MHDSLAHLKLQPFDLDDVPSELRDYVYKEELALGKLNIPESQNP
jgi:hypothetical protein